MLPGRYWRSCRRSGCTASAWAAWGATRTCTGMSRRFPRACPTTVSSTTLTELGFVELDDSFTMGETRRTRLPRVISR
jgi:hypothetical protein